MPSNPPRNVFQQEDDGWSRAIELALTPVVAAGLGWVVDHFTGLFPAFTIAFFVFAMVATFVKMYLAYDKKMQEHDAESPWGRARAHAEGRTPEPATTPVPATGRPRVRLGRFEVTSGGYVAPVASSPDGGEE